jgi:hypothetical protein
MKKVWNLLVTLLVIVGVIAVAFSIINWKNSSTTKDIPSEEVARYIGEHSVLYVQTGCIHCKEQEDLFGVNVKYLHIFDCAASKENALVCSLGGITATPTWIINGEKYTGVQSVDKLKELTGYK